MIGSNEELWKKYQQEKSDSLDYWREYQKEPEAGLKTDWKKRSQAVKLKKARLVQSGVDPEESFNRIRSGLLVMAAMLAIIGVICLVAL